MKLVKEVAQLYQEALNELSDVQDLSKEDRVILEENVSQLRMWYHGLAQFDEKYVWCLRCRNRHRINTKIAKAHPTIPIPLECHCDADHIFDLVEVVTSITPRFKQAIINIGIKNGFNGAQIFKHTKPRVEVYKCIICEKIECKDIMDMTPWFDEILEEYERLD